MCNIETGFKCAGGNATSKSTCSCADYYLTPTDEPTKLCSMFCNPATTCSGHGTCSSTGVCLCDRQYGLTKNCATGKTPVKDNSVPITNLTVDNAVLLQTGEGVVIPAGALAAGLTITVDQWSADQLDASWTSALSSSQVRVTESCCDLHTSRDNFTCTGRHPEFALASS